ncbi:MAG: glycosyl hydrolase, partial [Pyrinomonadaceae bacterium]
MRSSRQQFSRTLSALLSALMIFTTFAAPPARAQDQEKKAEKKGAEDAKRDEAQKTEAEKKQQEDASKQQATEAKPAAEARRQEEPRKPEPMSAPTFAGLRLRSIGPAFTSGRVVGFAVEPKDHSHYFVATASGGVWKTENGGTTFRSVFDGEGSYSIGWIVLDQKNPLNVWVGAGENNSQRSVSYGDGVYKSEDGGKTWRNVGLKKSEHIGRIAIDPRDSNVVYVAAQGPLWGPGGDRGLYKTTDGGKTWKNVLSISENTGVTDVVIDPDSPDTLLAAAYQRRRHYWTLIDGGPEGGIYKSTDAGATWKRVRAGLPANVDVGRIGLYISPADTNVVYAVVEAADNRGGIYRSSDRGESWERRNPYDVTAMYYARIVADPKDVDRIYVMNVLIQVSDDGGRTLRPLGERSKHVDNHDIWIDPDNTNHYLVGCDGGVYESWDRA